MIKVKKLFKTYKQGVDIVVAVNNACLNIKKGEFVAIVGPSGSGKSTLLHLLAGLDKADSGEIIINNTDITKLNNEEMIIFRRENIGFIFQFYNLLPMLSVKENILLPALLSGKKTNAYEKIINDLNIKDKENYLPNDLSGGQQQRTAIGRALINNPKILLCDEPTGNLDSVNAKKIMNLFKHYNELGQTIIMVTHDLKLAKQATRIITVKNGKIVKDIKNVKTYH